MMKEQQKLIGVKPPADAEKWHDYGLKLQQESPNRIEDAAKFLTTMISISLTLVISNLNDLLKIYSQTVWMKLCMALWIVSLALSFFVIYPRKYIFPSQSSEQIKKVHRQIFIYKRILFITAVICFFIPFLIYAVVFIIEI